MNTDLDGVIVYTANLGAYDDLSRVAGGVRHVCFSDGMTPIPQGWEVICVPPDTTLDSRIRRARYIKVMSHLVLPPHDVSIWVDANLALGCSVAALIEQLGTSDIATFAYPPTYGYRDCLYQEAEACIARHKDDPNKIRDQMSRYRAEHFPEHSGLVETSIVVRRHSERCAVFNSAWWAEIQAGSRRDQLSFNYVAWKRSLSYSVLRGSRRDNPFALFKPHLQDVYGAPS